VRIKLATSQLNVPHGTKNEKILKKTKNSKYQLSLTNPNDTLDHGERAAS